mgnify:CR=1 FL=1
MRIFAFADEANSAIDKQIEAMVRNNLQGLEIRGVDGKNVSGGENMALVDREDGQIVVGYISFEKRFPGMDAGSEGKLVFWQQMEVRQVSLC